MMGARIVAVLAVIFPFAFAASSAAAAGAWVDFTSAGKQPTPFQIKQAKAQGKESKVEPGIPLRALLVRPDGVGPFPAVVLLHGCDGLRPFQQTWADTIAKLGYVALLVDSFGSRGITETCSKVDMSEPELVNDAFGALAYLRGQPFVVSDRVGVMGWGLGGEAAMSAVDDGGQAQLFPQDRFRASIALYAGIAGQAKFIAPVLLMLAAEDDWTPLARTEAYVKASEPSSQPITLRVYPTLAGFDDPDRGTRFYLANAYNPQSASGKGATFGYDATSAADARQQVQDFFSKYLK